MMIPSFRTMVAVQDKVEKRLLFRTWGGLGDQICAEPTLRHALRMFKDCEFFFASERPELFRHLTRFQKVFDLRHERPIYEQYLLLDTITPPDDSNLVWQFMGHLLTNCVDFPSLCALRLTLPVAEKQVVLSSNGLPVDVLAELQDLSVVVHPGRHWPSKTFPKEWWDRVLTVLIDHGVKPVLIGADTDDNRGTVDVDPTDCLDLRNKLTISQSVALCQDAAVVLTNDSAPLHMAASVPPREMGQKYGPWIGYVATCKHPDMITHWRGGEWGWRMKNFGKTGVWDEIDYCPNKEQQVTVDEWDARKALPPAEELAEWAVSRLKSF